MKVFPDCLPCMIRQVLEASRMATDNSKIKDRILDETLKILPNFRRYDCSPDLVMILHRIVKEYTNTVDPYRKTKDKDIHAAKKLYPYLEEFLNGEQDTLYWALKIAATGNNLDSAIGESIDIEEVVENELKKEFAKCDLKNFKEKLQTANSVLIIGDNAGETVFDNILVKYLMPRQIIYAVRNAPIINDATIEDAKLSGLDEFARIISTGCDAPGAILNQCSEEFMKFFQKADLVISKGQGNFEALSECEEEVYFLLKAKCPVIADYIEVGIGEYVFIKYN